MRTSIRRRVSHALGVTPRDLTAVWKLLEKNFAEVEVSARCTDGSVLETAVLNELVDFGNPGFRRIQSVEITARTSDEERFGLDIGADGSSTAIGRIESADDAAALHLSNAVVGLLRDAKPGYSPLSQVKVSYVLVAGWALWSASNSFRRALGQVPRSPIDDRVTAIDIINIGIVVGALFLLFVWPIDKFQSWLFPRVFFVIGRQAEEWKRRERARSFLGIGFVLSVVASVVATFVVDWMKR